MDLTIAEDVYMGEVVGQLGQNITRLTGIFPIWQEWCEAEREDWAIIHWLDPERMVRRERCIFICNANSFTTS